jgi:two-component system, LytTR family, sensor kinase
MVMKLFPKRIRDISFWYYQTTGWAFYSTVQLVIYFGWHGTKSHQFLDISLQLITIFFLLLILRWYFRKLPFQTMGLFPLISRIFIASFILTIIWLVIWIGIEYIFIEDKLIKYLSDPLNIVLRISYSFPVFLGWSALYFGIKIWQDWLTEREQTEQAIEAAQHAQLQMLRYQLNPHFLFNALNSVRALVDEEERSAKIMITELSEFLRYSLISRNKPIVALKDEIDAIRLYLSIEQQRYEDKLQVHYEIDEQTEDIPVPSFLIHPLVEDALRNGMRTSTMPLHLEIKSTLNDGIMNISVNHSGSNTSKKGGGFIEPGMEQVEARLKELFPGRFHLSSRQQDNQAQSILELVITNGLNYDEKIASIAH